MNGQADQDKNILVSITIISTDTRTQSTKSRSFYFERGHLQYGPGILTFRVGHWRRMPRAYRTSKQIGGPCLRP